MEDILFKFSIESGRTILQTHASVNCRFWRDFPTLRLRLVPSSTAGGDSVRNARGGGVKGKPGVSQSARSVDVKNLSPVANHPSDG
ncbi:hypothetical protein CEXT_477341 [Caerostris extrusa]|uniref:Uncharacterized protein n=1 Tax=Caerostris extrusa TaxID=172846 RepID=A0AAV4MFR8_CAEEX|nr:hypothetical protein CEXT_477341 [Caerostris extrusa]